MMGNERFNNDHKHFSNMIISVMNVFKLLVLERSPTVSLTLCVCVRLCVCVYTHALSVFITRESTFKEHRLFFEMWIRLCSFFSSCLSTVRSSLFLPLSLAPLLSPCHSPLYFKLSPTFQSVSVVHLCMDVALLTEVWATYQQPCPQRGRNLFPLVASNY